MTEALIVTHKSEKIQEFFRYEESTLNNFGRCIATTRLPKKMGGFTLIELIITVAVLAILLTIGVPSFRDVLDRRRVTNATTNMLTQLQQARSLSILLNRSVQMSFLQDAGGWCFGVTDKVNCNCRVEDLTANNSCTVGKPDDLTDRILVVGKSTSYPNVVLSWSGTGGYSGKAIVFEPTRGLAIGGLADSYFQFTSEQTSRSTRVSMSRTGKIAACAEGSQLWGGLKKCIQN